MGEIVAGSRNTILSDLEEDFNPFMNAAAACAFAGVWCQHGGPFGACIVKNNLIIAVSHNCVLTAKDPTAHAEVVCIRQAAKVLKSHDLSDCQLYSTCDPCPMCWGAIRWARIPKLYVGTDPSTPAKYGFDDAHFHEQVRLPLAEQKVSGLRGLRRQEVRKRLLETSPAYVQRLRAGRGLLAGAYDAAFSGEKSEDRESQWASSCVDETHETFMDAALNAAVEGARNGESKEREPFGAVIVKDGEVIATACNTVLKDRDPTATAEVNAIRQACQKVKNWSLEGCQLYTTAEPDLMSLGAIYWSRLQCLHSAASLKDVATFGYADSLIQYQEFTAEKGDFAIEKIDGVMPLVCEKLFQKWQSFKGQLY